MNKVCLFIWKTHTYIDNNVTFLPQKLIERGKEIVILQTKTIPILRFQK